MCHFKYSIFRETSQHPFLMCLHFSLLHVQHSTVHVLSCVYACVCALSDSAAGELKISNHSQSFAGIYLCEVSNAVGAEHCRINLNANKRKGTHPHTDGPCPSHITHDTLTG